MLGYLLDPSDLTSVYTKRMEVNSNEYLQDKFSILVLLDVPTSAVLKQKYDNVANPWSKQNLFRVCFSFVAPIMWWGAVRYTLDMQQYSLGNFWIQWGLWLLFWVGCVSSLCAGYLMISHANKVMLYGGATQILPFRLPPKFLEGNDDGEVRETRDITNSSSNVELV